jgi:acetylornithine deacetylase/succinyl-diaminopimelate desuccinylase-like protein
VGYSFRMNWPSWRLVVLASFLSAPVVVAQTPKQAAQQWRTAHEQQILQEFTALLSIPNVAGDTTNIQRNAEVLAALLARRHVDAKLLTAAGSNPVVYGEIKTPGAKHTIVFYAHYDGQAVNPDDWESRAPFTPVTKMVNGEPRIYARSASDDKAAIIAQLTALDALQAAHIPIKANLHFVWEGEEEAGSTNLGAVLQKYRDQLGGDVCSSAMALSTRADGRAWSSERAVSPTWPSRSTGLTVNCTVGTTVTGPRIRR